MRRSTLLPAAAIAVVVAALPASASAATVVRSCSIFACAPELRFTAAPGERNDVVSAVALDTTAAFGSRYWIFDRGAPITLGPSDGFATGNGCAHPRASDPDFPYDWRDAAPGHVAACRWGDDARVEMALGDRNDRASIAARRGVLSGGDGNDSLTVGSGTGSISGDAGNDTLYGSDDANVLDGGGGQDVLDGGFGDDNLHGGAGNDTVWYRAPVLDRGSVIVTIGTGVRDDGQPGEHDTVYGDVENVWGTHWDDVLVGSEAANELIGFSGDDMLIGAGGDDHLEGGGLLNGAHRGGSNILDGGAGRDELVGGQANDDLDGGPGDDMLSGDDPASALQGSDVLVGGDGDDMLDGGRRPFDSRGNPTADDLIGGAGRDTADYVQRTDGVVVSLDGVPNDGAPGEQDYVDTEDVLGGSADDELTGDTGPNLLDGGAGHDFLAGGLGADALSGGRGSDIVSYAERLNPVFVSLDKAADDGERFKTGGEGDRVGLDVEEVIGGAAGDTLTGGAGYEPLHGGPGEDLITGLGGSDVLTGDTGDDKLYARDGVKDLVGGGDGEDSGDVDAEDVIEAIEMLL